MNAINAGDTAFIVFSAALVMFMTPVWPSSMGYGTKQERAGTIMHSFFILGLVTITWVLWGYSNAFGPDLAGYRQSGLVWADRRRGRAVQGLRRHHPTSVFMLFQLMFAIITPALITGTFAERMKFSTFVVFILLWCTLVYNPVAHWVWGIGGWLRTWGPWILPAGPWCISIRASRPWRGPGYRQTKRIWS